MPDRSKSLRRVVMSMLVLFLVQYELGITVIMSNPPSISPIPLSDAAFRAALDQVGGVLYLHSIMGVLLVVISIVNLVMALQSGKRSVQVFGSLSFLGIAIAAGGGLFFVLSGFQNDHASHAMATNFLLSFAFLFLEFYYMKPEPMPKISQ
jgi:heme A synthase